MSKLFGRFFMTFSDNQKRISEVYYGTKIEWSINGQEESFHNLGIPCKLGCPLDRNFENVLNFRILVSECISF